jgi:hypothetical protein
MHAEPDRAYVLRTFARTLGKTPPVLQNGASSVGGCRCRTAWEKAGSHAARYPVRAGTPWYWN